MSKNLDVELDTILKQINGRDCDKLCWFQHAEDDRQEAKTAIKRLIVQEKIKTVDTALNACPSKDNLLRKWLIEHKESLEKELEQ